MEKNSFASRVVHMEKHEHGGSKEAADQEAKRSTHIDRRAKPLAQAPILREAPQLRTPGAGGGGGVGARAVDFGGSAAPERSVLGRGPPITAAAPQLRTRRCLSVPLAMRANETC